MACQAALEVLRDGGNAFDAYATISAVLALTQPQSLSAGGGGWMMMYVKAEDRVVCLDHMGRIPYAATPEIFAALDSPWNKNYLSALVPGNLGGWYELHRKYGSLPLERVWAPAIDYAENGFPASGQYARTVSMALLNYPTTAAIHLPNGRPPVEGEICYNKDLANTYRNIINYGIDWLYTGEGAQMIVDHFAKNGGLITARDLAEFSADWFEPISTDYKGYEVFAPPPEGSITGIIALEALQILKGYDLKEMGLNSADYIHTVAEAFKLADADYFQLCIPEERGGGPIPVEWLLSEEHAAKQRDRIDSTRASAVPGSDRYLAEPVPGQLASTLEIGTEAGGTLASVIADKYGNVIVGIQSSGLGYGTQIVIEGLGFPATSMLQFADRNADYVWAIKGGAKVPIGMTPILAMKDGKPWAATGAGGTETIVQIPIQLFLNMVEFGMTPQDAIEAPRFACLGTWADPPGQPGKFEFHRSNRMELEICQPITFETALQLANRGHYILPRTTLSLAGYQLLVIDPKTGTFMGASDIRGNNNCWATGW